MNGIRISVVKYINAFPFLYGLMQRSPAGMPELTRDVPSECARKVLSGEADIGLIPVAAVKQMKSFHIAGDFCVGATGPVYSVALYSNTPVEEVSRIYLDSSSRSSVALLKILAREKWKINPVWCEDIDLPDTRIKHGDSALVIGDRTFTLEGKFVYKYDLAQAWVEHTGLPFVFACFVSREQLPASFIADLNASMRYGTEHLEEALEALLSTEEKKEKKRYFDYLSDNVSYPLDEPKRRGMELFLSKLP